MAVPDFQSMMLPLLRFASDKKVHTLAGACEALIIAFSISDEDVKEMLPSGNQTRFKNRVGWAKTFLLKSRLLHSPKRSQFLITERGLNVLAQNPDRIDMKYLEQFEEYRSFRGIGTIKDYVETSQRSMGLDSAGQTPEEMFELAYSNLHSALAAELMDLVRSSSPEFFEKLVVELLVKMGYGGSRKEAAKAVGRSGDEGIDGIIDEDRLGLDVIYIQAKRWNASSISRPEIQKFVGALQGKRAKKGVFITCSEFTNGAREYVSIIEPRVVLIDGQRLANLMIEFNIGVAPTQSFELKKIDSDYFEG